MTDPVETSGASGASGAKQRNQRLSWPHAADGERGHHADLAPVAPTGSTSPGSAKPLKTLGGPSGPAGPVRKSAACTLSRDARARNTDPAVARIVLVIDEIFGPDAEEIDAWEERAAIREYDGGQCREVAEQMAAHELGGDVVQLRRATEAIYRARPHPCPKCRTDRDSGGDRGEVLAGRHRP